MSIDRYESELLPEDKAKNILKFQSKGSNVIMIGDGVNDAPALSYANVGVALGSTRTDVAMEAADITITQDNPLLVPGVIGLSKNTVKTIKENFAMVIGLNTFALVLGATGILAPIYASVLHNSTTILVVMNSLKLLKYDIKTNQRGDKMKKLTITMVHILPNRVRLKLSAPIKDTKSFYSNIKNGRQYSEEQVSFRMQLVF